MCRVCYFGDVFGFFSLFKVGVIGYNNVVSGGRVWGMFFYAAPLRR